MNKAPTESKLDRMRRVDLGAYVLIGALAFGGLLAACSGSKSSANVVVGIPAPIPVPSPNVWGVPLPDEILVTANDNGQFRLDITNLPLGGAKNAACPGDAKACSFTRLTFPDVKPVTGPDGGTDWISMNGDLLFAYTGALGERCTSVQALAGLIHESLLSNEVFDAETYAFVGGPQTVCQG